MDHYHVGKTKLRVINVPPSSSSFERWDTSYGINYPFTMFCWFTTPSQTQRCLGGIFTAAADNHWFNMEVSTTFRIGARDGSGQANYVNAGTTQVTTNVWHAGCGVFTSSTSRTAYMDASSGTGTTGRSPSGMDRISIGLQDTATAANGFSNGIAHFTIWKVALSAGEVRSMTRSMIHPMLVRPNSIVLYHPGYKTNNVLNETGSVSGGLASNYIDGRRTFGTTDDGGQLDKEPPYLNGSLSYHRYGRDFTATRPAWFKFHQAALTRRRIIGEGQLVGPMS